MNNLVYCLTCKRIFQRDNSCAYCNDCNIKNLEVTNPVNVIGTKIKGKVLKIDGEEVKILTINTDTQEKLIKVYNCKELRKIL
ncbi:hypothetical protein [Clostridium sp.]|uniref:hypothetical protein n=1 Tax=Clostridium sp. TaxID=1506 RepID=UPI003464BB36